MLWEEISKKLQKKGVFYSAKVCETKMKNLKRTYNACVDHNKVCGNDIKKCKLFDVLEEIFSRHNAVQWKAVCGNLDGTVKQITAGVNNAESSSSTTDTEEPKVMKKKKLSERKRKQEDLVGLFNEFKEDTNEERVKMSELENMHMERMTLMNRFLGVFQKLLDKE